MSLTVSGILNLLATQVASRDLGEANSPAAGSVSIKLTNGTGANQADLVFDDTRTTADETLDLAGSLSDAFGNTITFARIKAIYIKAAAANTVDIYVGGAATNQFATFVGDASDKIVIKPGGALFLYDAGATAYAVTAGTGDNLKIAASDGATSISYDIILVGASA